MKKQIKQFEFERISSQMQREFGSIKKGNEDEYNFLLMPMECNLLKVSRLININNGRRVVEAIHCCLFIIDSHLTGIEYDLGSYISDENKEFTRGLLMSFDPFTNKEIFKIIKKDYDLNAVEDLRKYFTVPVKCLLRIEKSIEFWTKDYGPEGYFNFIDGQFGSAVNYNDKMDFGIEKKFV